jgi:RNA polymerase sigma factor (sigma-70 family)
MSQIKAWEPQTDVPGGFADESAMVAGLRARSPEAFEALHAAYAASIYNLALRIVDDSHEAQDVAQEVLIKVFRGLPAEDEEFTLPAWLYRVTVNASFDHLRTRKRRPVTVTSEAAPEPPSAVDEFERAELARRVEDTLKELPKRQQVALVLRDVHGLSVGETASVLGVTKGSADVLLSRARAGFRKVFLAGVHAAGRCSTADAILAGGVGGGVSAADHARLEDHARTCPDCRRTSKLWGVAPAGLGLLLPQVALPAKLSLGATLMAAQAAGVVLPAGLGAAAGAGSAAVTGGSGTAASAAGASAAAGSAAGSAAAAGTGVLAALGSAAGVKIATLAAVAVAGVGIAGVASRHQAATTVVPPVGVAAQSGGPGAGAGGAAAGVRTHARLLAQAHRGQAPGGAGLRGDDGGKRGQAGRGSDRPATAAGGTGAKTGGGSTQGAGQGTAGGAGSGGTTSTSSGQAAAGATGGSGTSGGSGGPDTGSGSGGETGAGGSGTGTGTGTGTGGTGGTDSGGGQTAGD